MRIYIEVRGGSVEDVFCDRSEYCEGIEYVVCDWDTYGQGWEYTDKACKKLSELRLNMETVKEASL